MLRVHNSLTGAKEEFRPREPGRVGVYVCGMTVYDYCHLGHARMMVVFDMVVRHLRATGYTVDYVRNITDIDDKMIRRAQEAGEALGELAERFITAMDEDCEALGLLRPDREPRATAYMDQIIAMIDALIARGHAYPADNGDVYYAVGSFEGYGKLSGKRVDELRIGARIEPGEAKRDALDFALWKAAKPDEPQWDSPWGPGRPGWHIECSAMSTHCLGEHFDIHGGGMDLKFPHHENEIAQSEGATGQPFVNYWLHNGFVQVGDEKMSKSLNNFHTIRDLLALHSGEEIRFFLLSTHYRSPLCYTGEAMASVQAGLRRLYASFADVADGGAPVSAWVARFDAAMNDDFNTPQAFAVLHDLARELNSAKAAGQSAAVDLAATLRGLGGRLGLLSDDPQRVLRGAVDTDQSVEIEGLIAARNRAREEKDWAEADRIRDELAGRGIVLEDKPGGQTLWRRA